MELQVQQYLRNGGTPEELKSKLGINCKRSERHPSLRLFKYDQIDSPNSHPIVNECRGLILNADDNWCVVAHPFHRFFNYGDTDAATIDFSTARVQEKLDGSLMTMYWYGGEWNVATSGNPDAAGRVGDNLFDFRELFWKTFDQMKFPLDMCEEDTTYMFELTSPYNKVVVPHAEAKLSLIGINHCVQGDWEEGFVSYYPDFNPVREFKLTSINQIVESFASIDGMRQEGYVVVDNNFNRIKVKHPQYIALHHMKDSLGSTVRHLVEIARTGEQSEFLSYFPEFQERYDDVKRRYDEFIDGMDVQYDIIRGDKPKVNRKDFALEATKTKLPGYFFARLDGKVDDIKHYVKDMQIDALMKCLKLKE